MMASQFIVFHSRAKCEPNWENKIYESMLCLLLLVIRKHLIFYTRELVVIRKSGTLNIVDFVFLGKLAYLLSFV